MGVTGNPIALTITWSFALFPDANVGILHQVQLSLPQVVSWFRHQEGIMGVQPLRFTPMLPLWGKWRSTLVKRWDMSARHHWATSTEVLGLFAEGYREGAHQLHAQE